MAKNLKCDTCEWEAGKDEGAISHIENNPSHTITGTVGDGDTITIGYPKD